MEEKTLYQQLVNTKFGLEYIKVLGPLTSKHLKIFLENKGSDYDQIGDDKEKKIKGISHIYGLLQNCISDLELVLKFLRIDRKTITQMYPTIDSQKEYYKYHLENFIIRTTTISDIVGKLGNLIFETGLDQEKCNGYSFKEKIKETDPNCSKIVEELLKATKDIKDKRHQKLHTGDTKMDYLEGIVFWDEISKIIGDEASPLLDNLTDQEIKDEIDGIEKDIRSIIDIVVKFMDYSVDKFKEIANR